MTIKKTLNDSELTLALNGRLDTINAPRLEAELKSSLCGVEHLVLDFEKLAYLSSAGLRVLLAAQKIMLRAISSATPASIRNLRLYSEREIS